VVAVTTASFAVMYQMLFSGFVECFQKPRATIQKAAMVGEGVDMHEQGVLVDVLVHHTAR
jgi:hypothetical protein